MSNHLSNTCISGLHQYDNADALRRNEVSILRHDNTPIGIIVNIRLAEAIMGNSAWDTRSYGMQITYIDAETTNKKQIQLITKHDQHTKSIIFNKKFLKNNWSEFQFIFGLRDNAPLTSQEVMELGETFDLPVFPHTVLNAGGYKTISFMNNEFGFFAVNRNQGKCTPYNLLAEEIEQLSCSVSLKETTKEMRKPYAVAMPSNITQEITDRLSFAQIDHQERTPKTFFYKDRSIDENEGLLITNPNTIQGTQLKYFVFHPQPSDEVQEILRPYTPELCQLQLLKSCHIDRAQQTSKVLSRIDIGTVITAKMLEAIGSEKTEGRWINSRAYEQQFFAATTNQRVIDLVQQLPLCQKTKIIYQTNGFLPFAADKGQWFRNSIIRDDHFEHHPERKQNALRQVDTTCKQLWNIANNIHIIESNGQQIAVTGSQEVARAMYTIEQHLGMS